MDDTKEKAMNMANDDLTLNEVLTDPMIRAVMRADGVTSSQFRTLLYSAANALENAKPEPGGARTHAAKLLAAPKRRLLAMVHPLAVRTGSACAACY
ncbi:hypothetical protein ASG39_08945 [Rhizobium sp. Leaf371]|nr:hypothetical protein ASG39_08945 [Rhizobium sp. Leaf371]